MPSKAPQRKKTAPRNSYNANRRIPFSAKNILNNAGELSDRKKTNTANLFLDFSSDSTAMLTTDAYHFTTADLANICQLTPRTCADQSLCVAYEPLRFRYASSEPPGSVENAKCDGRKFYYKHLDLDLNISCRNKEQTVSSPGFSLSPQPATCRVALLSVRGDLSDLNAMRIWEPFSKVALADSKKFWVIYDKTYMVSQQNPVHIERFFKLNLEMTRSQAASTSDTPASINSETNRIVLLIWTDDHSTTDGTSASAQCDVYCTGKATAVGFEM